METSKGLEQILSSGRADPGTQTEAVKPRRRVLTRIVLPVGIFASFAAISGYAFRDSLTPAVPVNVVLPAIDPAGEAESASASAAATPLFQAPGWIEPFPYHMTISSSTPGVLGQLHVLEGMEVTPGTLAAELLDEDARVALEQSQAELALRQAELKAAEAARDNPLPLREATRAAQAQLDRLIVEKSRAEQKRALAERESEIGKNLATRGATGSFAAERLASEARDTQLSVAELDSQIAAAKAGLELAKQRLGLLIDENNRVLVARAAVSKAEAGRREAEFRLRQRKVYAQTSGTIMSLYVGEGATLSMDGEHGLQIASIYDPAKLQVRADVPLAEVTKLQIGQPVEIAVDAFPNRAFHGEVVRIVHEADVQKNTLPVKVRILDPDPGLKPEMIARLQFLSRGDTHVDPQTSPARASARVTKLMIPATVARGNDKDVRVWVVAADQTARLRHVELGPTLANGMRAVISGIEAPDKIIATNTEKLKEGSRVHIAATD